MENWTRTDTYECGKILSALIVAAFAGWITWRQLNTAKAKLKLDLFERRFEIYLLHKSLINGLLRAKPDPDGFLCDVQEIERKMASKAFLFPDSTVKYLDDSLQKAKDYYCIEIKLRNRKENTEHEENMKKANDIQKWAGDQSMNSEEEFLNVLDFKKIL